MRIWLREIRKNKKLSEKYVANNAGIVQPFYHHIETGEKNPSVCTAKKIAAVLDFNWTRFFDAGKQDDELLEHSKENQAV